AGMITDNRTGEPVEGAKVQVWTRGQNGGWAMGEAGTTDKNGLYAVPAADQRGHMVVVTHKDQQIASSHDWYTYRGGRHDCSAGQGVIFTERSPYRPGQLIQFKGITVRFNHANDNYETVANRDVDVLFSDVNGKEIARHKAKSNDYGSFSGNFTAPRDRLMGHMSIRTVDGRGYTG